MRVIFIQDIAGVAHRDQVREVSDGYALNFLLPKGLAVRANPEKIAAVALRAKAAEQTQVKARIQAEKYAIQLRGRAVTIEARQRIRYFICRCYFGRSCANYQITI